MAHQGVLTCMIWQNPFLITHSQVIATLVTGEGKVMIEESRGFLTPSHINRLWSSSLVPHSMRVVVLRLLSQVELMLVRSREGSERADEGALLQ